MEVVKLSDHSSYIPVSVEECLNKALRSDFKAKEAIVLFYSEEEDSYEYHFAGDLRQKDLLWHAEQFKAAVLGGRLNEFGEE